MLQARYHNCSSSQKNVQKSFFQLDLVMEKGAFIHFYDGPQEAMEPISSNVIFVFDVALTGEKLMIAKNAFGSLMEALNPKDQFSVVFFNGKFGKEPSSDWPNFTASPENIQVATDYVLALDNEVSNISSFYLTEAIGHAQQLALSNNVINRIVLLTDGGRGQDNTMIPHIDLPIAAVGIEANIEFLHQVANKAYDLVENLIEDVPVGDQLKAVKRHLSDVLLKDLHLRYLGQEGELNLTTSNHFPFLSREAGVVVAGLLSKHQEIKTVEVIANNSLGDYSDSLRYVPGEEDLGCNAQVIS